MPPQTAAARRASVAPRHPRRVSGPVRRPARLAPAPAHAARGRTAAFERLRALPDHRIVDGLLRSRAWIVVVAVMLGGIVAMQVSLLKLNSGISRAVEASATLQRENANMQTQIARLSSGQRVGQAAARKGMIFPAPGDVDYLRARGALDDGLAARRVTPPSAQAQAVMANGGHDPGTTVTPDPTATTATTVTPAATSTTPTTATATTPTAATPTATPQG